MLSHPRQLHLHLRRHCRLQTLTPAPLTIRPTPPRPQRGFHQPRNSVQTSTPTHVTFAIRPTNTTTPDKTRVIAAARGYTRRYATHVPPRAVSVSLVEERDRFRSKDMETDIVVKRMSRERLAELLLLAAEAEAATTSAVAVAAAVEKDGESSGEGGKAKKEQVMKIAIVDVRDSDHVGGHIRSSIHSPSTIFTVALDSLLHTLKPYDAVIFHCALSQQRGPSAAIKYAREKRALEARRKVASSEEEELLYSSVKGSKDQEVYVLDGGFVKWQEKYGDDKRLTEAYDAEIWSMGY
ncbi:hypothetical protein TWF696_004582 [Orbilia brochopaga]|uniref:Rhodanese domain-containing protein n=1 Tax=Orbilia brochopaga TaxID=3140254 RepID=A0AAV9V7C1_9PEZI